jgi:hypothetical protein
MPAIITSELRKQIARDFFDQFSTGQDRYYIGIGRSEQWDSTDRVPTPQDTPVDITGARHQLQSIKKVEDSSLVVPRNNWTSGFIYSQYDDTVAGYSNPPYYVKTENNHVYICLSTGRNAQGVAVPSTIEPTGAPLRSFQTADGYVWKFIYTISAQRANSFVAANFMPVQQVPSVNSASTGIVLHQYAVQQAAIRGAILSIAMINGGSGYTSRPTVNITSVSGGNALASAFIDSSLGIVTKVELDADSTTFHHGSGYLSADIEFTGGGGTGALARAILGPDSGIGRDARVDLKASSIMYHSKLEGDDSDFIVGQDFRQVTLIRNPRRRDGSNFNDLTGNCLDKLTLSNIITVFQKDKILQGQTSLAEAYIDNIDSNEIYYHQTVDTGFVRFQDGEILQEKNGAGEGIIDSGYIASEVDRDAGSILYIDNRGAVLRDPTQAEDVKVIIQF